MDLDGFLGDTYGLWQAGNHRDGVAGLGCLEVVGQLSDGGLEWCGRQVRGLS